MQFDLTNIRTYIKYTYPSHWLRTININIGTQLLLDLFLLRLFFSLSSLYFGISFSFCDLHIQYTSQFFLYSFCFYTHLIGPSFCSFVVCEPLAYVLVVHMTWVVDFFLLSDVAVKSISFFFSSYCCLVFEKWILQMEFREMIYCPFE